MVRIAHFGDTHIKNLKYHYEYRKAFEEIYDLFAIRIVLDSDIENEKTECWQVYSCVTDCYHPNPDRLKDWISTPKTNGYESLL